MVCEITALVLLVWAGWHLACGQQSGVIGKILYFLVAVEAGAVCFPAGHHLPSSAAILPVLAVTIIYQELSLIFREKR